MPRWPGEVVHPRDELELMRASEKTWEKYLRYVAAMDKAHIDPAQLPVTMPACDCSRFVLWVLGMPHATYPKIGGLYTNRFCDDALTQRRWFVRDDSDAARLQTRVGSLLVFPGHGEEVGHIGIVTAVDGTDGRPGLVCHCAPENFLIQPGPGEERTAIRETSPQVFVDDPRTIAVWCSAVSR